MRTAFALQANARNPGVEARSIASGEQRKRRASGFGFDRSPFALVVP